MQGQDRPAYVVFELQAEEDRAASEAAGHYVSKDVEYAIVTPPGSKDRIPRRVDEWFPQLDQQAAEERLPHAWVESYKARYKAWKQGVETPLHGTPVSNWPVVSPAQVKSLQAAHLLTIEDLADANEEALARLGMGGRSLKQRALEWLAASRDVGKVSEELAAQKLRNKELTEIVEAQGKQLTELSSQLKSLLPKAG